MKKQIQTRELIGTIVQSMMRSRRRGSFIVLVVGTLAMISIIMIVYVAVGNADKRSSVAIARRDRSQEIIKQFSDYVAQIVADDAVTIVPDSSNFTPAGQPANLAGGDLYIREAWDAPNTSWKADSTKALTATIASNIPDPSIFRPVGLGDDPWLASTTPTWINYNPTQSTIPPIAATGYPTSGDQKPFKYRRDWLHISNVAPDGRFVNLFNLRGNFDAKAGTSNNASDRRMNADLSLLTQVRNPDSAPTDTNTTVWGETIGSGDKPAFFDSWQVGAFRPAKGPFADQPNTATYPPYQWADADGDGWFDSRWFEMSDARGSSNSATPDSIRSLLPADPNYRWVFATRIIDLSSLVNVNAAGDFAMNPDAQFRPSLPGTKISDAASSGQAEPIRKADVVGLSPADIDLQRLLRMRDFNETVLDLPPGQTAQPLQIEDVGANGSSSITRPYHSGYSAFRQPVNSYTPSQDYSRYLNDISKSSQMPAQMPGYPAVTNPVLELGDGSYRALRGSLAAGGPTGRFSDFTKAPLSTQALAFPTIRARSDYYNTITVPMERAIFDSATSKYKLGTGFRVDNLVELLTFRGVNDNRVTTALESASGGHFSSSMIAAPTPTDLPVPFGPLRENRSAELEREALTFSAGSKAGVPTEAALLKSFSDIRQYLTTHSGSRPIAPTLSQPNPVAAFVPEYPASLRAVKNPTVAETPQNDLIRSIFEIPENDKDKARPENSIYRAIPSPETLFQGYAAALMPGLPAGVPQTSDLRFAWQATDPKAKELRGLFYGHQGPMTALLAAGHMTANFSAAFQSPARAINENIDAFYAAGNHPYVLLLSEAAESIVAGDRERFPAWNKPSGSGSGPAAPSHRLSLARSATDKSPLPDPANVLPTETERLARIPTALADVPAPAVNIYGMGLPHPFLVEVATFTTFRDTYPVATVSDTQNSDLEVGNSPNPSVVSLVTINGNMDEHNPDFLFRVLAVKLHNPYPVPIRLSSDFISTTSFDTTTGTQFSSNTLEDMFYIQIGSGANAFYYLPVEVDETIVGGSYDGKYTVAPVVIEPGETIVFYAMNRNAQSVVQQRLNPTDRELSSDASNPQYLQDWLTAQLGKEKDTNFRRIKMLRVENAKFGKTGGPEIAYGTFKSGVDGILVPPTATDAALDQTVMLRRAVRIDSGTSSDIGSSANSVENDEICDRIRVDSTINLDRRLIEGPVSSEFGVATQVTGAWIDPAKADYPSSQPNATFTVGANTYTGTYDSRLTITLSSFFGRKGDPAGTQLQPGQIPAWAIDSKSVLPKDWYNHNQYPDVTGNPLKLTMAIFGPDANKASGSSTYKDAKFAGYTPKLWRRWSTEVPIFPSLPKRAEENTSVFDATSTAGNLVDIRRELSVVPNKFQGYKLGGIEKFINDNVPQIRPTDLLNVMAVGATHVPLDETGSAILKGTDQDLTKQWTTPAEALGIALGYTAAPSLPTEWKAASSPYGPLDYYYFDHPTSGTAKFLFDSGYLKTDDFVPTRFDTSGDPHTVGTGAPIAGNILTMMRTQPDGNASLTMSTTGLININTAPAAVLRLLPFAFPSKDEVTGKTFWIGPAGGGTTLPSDANREAEAYKTDIAAMIESYRDKIATPFRPGARTPAGAWFAPFIDRDSAGLNSSANLVNPNDAKIGDLTQSQLAGGRYWSSGIKGIREGAGFRSVGELLALRNVKFDQTTGAVTANADAPSNIDFMGYRAPADPTNLLGTDNVVSKTLLYNSSNKQYELDDIQPLQFGHTYQDKLKILSGLLGSVTVRSDMYAVWFIARGYQRSDCEGLPDLQPMVPTVERRFLMIIDRSNVTKIGQKPRVLAFVEVPL